jgi:hypothetical protein
MTCGPRAPNGVGPIARAQSRGMAGNDSAWASKSLNSRPWPRPSRRAASGPSISQGALVSLRERPSTGPAPQAMTELGRPPSFGIAASTASTRPG